MYLTEGHDNEWPNRSFGHSVVTSAVKSGFLRKSFLSPPFGYALFYLKSVAPPEITMAQIYRSSLPFLALQIVGLSICIIFPDVVLWLPRLVYG